MSRAGGCFQPNRRRRKTCLDSRVLAKRLGYDHHTVTRNIQRHKTRLEAKSVVRQNVEKPLEGSWLEEVHGPEVEETSYFHQSSIMRNHIIPALRHGELMALCWQDVDLEARRLSIKWTVSQVWGHGYIKSDPKSKKSRRTIQLPQFVVDALLRHRESQQERKKKAGDRWEENDLVFANWYGRYLAPGHTNIRFHRLLEQAGLPRIRIHDLRHSAASLLILVLKTPPKLVQELLGHSTLGMTMDIYTHADASQQREMMDAFDRFLGGNSE